MATETGLIVNQVSVSYGLHQALDQVSLSVKPGEIVVILGANGAGKSSLLKTIGGIVPRLSGSIELNGTITSSMHAHSVVEAGIALVPEGRGVFGELTVAENLALGAYSKRAMEQQQTRLQQVYHLFPKLVERQKQLVRTMSGGEQQMVAIGRALMSAPSILMLDEPSLGLSPLLASDVFKTLATIKETGLGILLVEQNAKQSLAIADRGYLLENGRIVLEDSAQSLLTDDAVRKAYLGGQQSSQSGTKTKTSKSAAYLTPAKSDEAESPAFQISSKVLPQQTAESLVGNQINDWIKQAEIRQREFWQKAPFATPTRDIPESSPEGGLDAMLKRMEQSARTSRQTNKNK